MGSREARERDRGLQPVWMRGCRCACDAQLDHVENVVVEHAAEDEVVRSLLRVRAKRKERCVVLLRQELHGSRILKRVHRIVPPEVHACADSDGNESTRVARAHQHEVGPGTNRAAS